LEPEARAAPIGSRDPETPGRAIPGPEIPDLAIPDLAIPDVEIPDLEIDVTTDLCPMSFVRTRLALDRLARGQILAVRLRGAEALRSVPRASAEQGHTVLAQTLGDDGVTRLLLRRK
jgi:TusA-related sulfurtransferase